MATGDGASYLVREGVPLVPCDDAAAERAVEMLREMWPEQFGTPGGAAWAQMIVEAVFGAAAKARGA